MLRCFFVRCMNEAADANSPEGANFLRTELDSRYDESLAGCRFLRDNARTRGAALRGGQNRWEVGPLKAGSHISYLSTKLSGPTRGWATSLSHGPFGFIKASTSWWLLPLGVPASSFKRRASNELRSPHQAAHCYPRFS